MKTLRSFHRTAVLALACSVLPITLAIAQPSSTFPEDPSSDDKIQAAVQITELGCMRTLLLLDSSSRDMEKIIAEHLTEYDFRVFPSANVVGSRLSSAELKQIGKENNADLVLYATVSTRLKNSMSDFQLYEAEATVQIASPVTGEIFVSHSGRSTGVRNVDAVEAERSAKERALVPVSKEAIARSLEKAHKIMVYRAVLSGIYSNTGLLAIMEHMGKMEGIYHVRRVSYNQAAREAEIEIIGSPKSENFWRTQLEKAPKFKVVKVVVNNNAAIRNKYPSWFQGH